MERSGAKYSGVVKDVIENVACLSRMDLNCRLLPYTHAVQSTPHLVKSILPWD